MAVALLWSEVPTHSFEAEGTELDSKVFKQLQVSSNYGVQVELQVNYNCTLQLLVV